MTLGGIGALAAARLAGVLDALDDAGGSRRRGPAAPDKRRHSLQSRTGPSSPAEASWRPSADQATDLTVSVWPLRPGYDAEILIVVLQLCPFAAADALRAALHVGLCTDEGFPPWQAAVLELLVGGPPSGR